MARVVIGIEGGIVIGASSDTLLDIVIFDYDTEGAEEEDIFISKEFGNECVKYGMQAVLVSKEKMDNILTKRSE